MEKGFDVKNLVMKATLAVLMVAICLSPAGCGKQMARIEQQQLELQKLVQINTQLITSDIARLEDTQNQLHVAIEDSQGDAKKRAAEIIAAIEQEQMVLQHLLQENGQQLIDSIAGIKQNHLELQKLVQNNTQLITSNMAHIKDYQNKLNIAIEGVQDGTKKQASDIIAVIEQEQMVLQNTLQQNSQQLNKSAVGIEQNQNKLQSQIEGLHTNIQQVDKNTAGLEQSLLKLQESLQNNTRDLANIIDVIGQKQLKFEEKIQSNVRAMAETLKAVQQNQAKLQEQIAAIQNNTQVTSSNMLSVLEGLRATLSQINAQISSAAAKKDEPSLSQINR